MNDIQTEPTLADVFRLIWKARLFILGGAVAGVVGAFIFLAVAVPHYRITMLVGPAERSAKADIKALLPDNPSFALQYLVSTMGSQDSNDFIRFENMLRGPTVAKALLGDKKITDGLARNGAFSFSARRAVTTPEELADLLNGDIAIAPVGNTPLRRVTYDDPSPEFGVYLLTRLYGAADGLIRRDVDAQAKSRAAYLQGMLGKVSNPDHRRALTALLMEQEHIQMILGADEPFAAIIAEAPSVSVHPWWPRKSMVFGGFLFAGMLLGFGLWGVRRGA